MPMDRSLYPENWEEIALAIKVEVGWKCEECGRECRRPGESLYDFIDRLVGGNWRDTCEQWAEIAEHPKRWILSVAHLNHIPPDCRRENLKALCFPCHCRYDLKAMATKRRLKRERLGQLVLSFDGQE